MRAALLMTISDFPARSSLSGWSGQGYYACPTCNVDTPSMRITSKTCYVGHRSWLPIDHVLRKNKKFNGRIEKSTPPKRKSTQDILEQLRNVPTRAPGKHEDYGGKKRKRKRRPHESNWTKKSIFWELPYWSSLSLRHNLDVMHIEKNVCESLLGTILSIDRKSKDTDKARLDMANLGVREELHLFKDGDQLMKPHAAYTLSPIDCTKFCEFLKHVRFPDGFASNLGKNVIGGNSKISGLKSHDCHVIMQRLLPIGIRPFMKKEIVDAITELCNFFQLICSRKLKVSDLKHAQKDIVVILCKLETIFPPAFFDIMVHAVMHLPEEAIRGGPVHLRWMYAIERFLGSLKKYVRNRAHPEGSIAEAYIANEALTFCSMYLSDIETRFNRLERNWIDSDVHNAGSLSIFQSRCRPIGKMSPITLDYNMRNKAEWYILQNCSEVQRYIDEHKEMISQRNAIGSLDEVQLREFPIWFQRKMFELQECSTLEVNKQLVYLDFRSSPTFKSYPGCIVNGVKFLTQRRDMNRSTQNSGVSVRGSDDQVFYGQLEDIYELSYGGNNSIVLFKCKWYNTSLDRRGQRRGIKEYKNKMSICIKDVWYENEPFILASQAEQVFYVEDLYNGPQWRVIEHFGHRHIWDLPPNQEDDMCVVQDVKSSGVELIVELPNLDSMLCNESSVSPNVVSSDVRVLYEKMQDGSLNNEEDEAPDDYNEESESESLSCGSGDDADDGNNYDDDDESLTYISSDDDSI
ncbi:unnamed protein product [Cuscuta epithymum]|uniref:DUF4218 domain-containing protein n=1 Tax=Cuscuta epithymum TaxID=186058 RepID=A0AAV0ED05_9ASTE|nr:unnamed protein product [Cuscuta epithymum]